LEAFSRCQIRATQLEQMHTWDAVRSLNLMLQSWANKGVNLFSIEQNVVSLAAGTAAYILPPEVVSITDAYYNQILSTGAGPDWDSPLYNPSEPIVSNDPQIVITQSQDRWLQPMGEADYARIPNKTMSAPPSQYWVNRLGPPYQLTLTVWPVPNLSYPQAAITYFAVRQLQTANLQNGETLDTPYRFLDAAAAELGLRLARKYAPKLIGSPGSGGLLDDAREAWVLAVGEDTAHAPVYLLDLGPYTTL
jgi:hypothetical protein